MSESESEFYRNWAKDLIYEITGAYPKDEEKNRIADILYDGVHNAVVDYFCDKCPRIDPENYEPVFNEGMI